MKSLSYQQQPTLWRTLRFILFMLALVILAGCNNQQSSAIPTPDLEILAPTATGVTARVEVVIVVVTATAAPAPSPTLDPTPEPSATDAASAPMGETAPETGGETAQQATAQPPAAPTQDATTASAGGQAQAQEMSNQQLINRGEKIYAEECASCHQLNGEGSDIFPGLNGSGVLESGDPTQAIQIVLYGRGEMPAFEDTLSNQQIASVLSYERNAWQNNGSVVRVAQIRQVRQGGSATSSGATTEGIAEMTDTTTVTVTATATATATVTDTSAIETTPTSGAEVAGESTPVPQATVISQATVTTSGDAGSSNAPLTWTPAFEVTPLLPTAAITGTAAMRTTVTVTANTSGDAGGPDVPLTWTPAREVTPLLPTAELAATGTPTPTAATATATAAADGAAAANAQELISRGETIYADNCATCHQDNGEGTSVYPALAGSEMLTADDPTAAITVVLHGEGEMPAFADVLSTAEIAAVLSHERTAWDNNASAVTVAQVEEVQGSSGN